MNTVLLVAGVLLASLAVVLVGKSISKRNFVRNRAAMTLQEIVRNVPCKNIELAIELVRVIGNSYRIAPELLREGDLFNDLAKLDSWSLGSGQDLVEKWLRERNLADRAHGATTIGDLLARVC